MERAGLKAAPHSYRSHLSIDMTKHRGHYCRICGSTKSNESFSGKGHRTHICKQCASMPKEKRQFVQAQEEVYTFLSQSHITDRNVSKLRQLAASENSRISRMACPMLEIVQAAPRKKQRALLTTKMRDAISAKWAESGIVPIDDYENEREHLNVEKDDADASPFSQCVRNQA